MAGVCLQQNWVPLGQTEQFGCCGVPNLWFLTPALRKAPTITQRRTISELHWLKMQFYFGGMSAEPFPLRCPSRQGAGAVLGMCQPCFSEPGMIWTSINEAIRGKKCSRDGHHVFPNKYIKLQICLLRFWEQLLSVT